MASERVVGRAWVVTLCLVGVTAWSGCRRQSDEPTYNRNLGDKPGELMPVAAAPADGRILEDQKGVEEEGLGQAARRVQSSETDQEAEQPDAEKGAKPARSDKKGKGPASRTGRLGGAARPGKGKSGSSAKTAKSAAAARGLGGAVKPAKPNPAKAKTSPAKAQPKSTAAKPAKPKAAPKKPSAKPTAKTPAKSAAKSKGAAAPAKPAAKSGSAKAAKGRTVTGLSLKMSAPWKSWKPAKAEGLIAAYTQKGVADVGAWTVPIPKKVKPEMLNSEPGRFVMAGVMKEEASKRFGAIDKWKPLNKTVIIDGATAIEVSCTLRKGQIAGVKTGGQAVCWGLLGKTKAFLVTYQIKTGAKNASSVRKAILEGIALK